MFMFHCMRDEMPAFHPPQPSCGGYSPSRYSVRFNECDTVIQVSSTSLRSIMNDLYDVISATDDPQDFSKMRYLYHNLGKLEEIETGFGPKQVLTVRGLKAHMLNAMDLASEKAAKKHSSTVPEQQPQQQPTTTTTTAIAASTASTASTAASASTSGGDGPKTSAIKNIGIPFGDTVFVFHRQNITRNDLFKQLALEKLDEDGEDDAYNTYTLTDMHTSELTKLCAAIGSRRLVVNYDAEDNKNNGGWFTPCDGYEIVTRHTLAYRLVDRIHTFVVRYRSNKLSATTETIRLLVQPIAHLHGLDIFVHFTDLAKKELAQLYEKVCCYPGQQQQHSSSFVCSFEPNVYVAKQCSDSINWTITEVCRMCESIGDLSEFCNF